MSSACTASLRGYGVNEAMCAGSASPISCGGAAVRVPATLRNPAAVGCRRNIFLDMGANWCNTMRLFEDVPEVKAGKAVVGSPWHVFAIEAAPLISPYVEKCVTALAAGKPLPEPPVPPAGSSMQLLNYAPDLGCGRNTGKGRRERMNCVAKSLEQPLAALARTLDPSLTSNPALLHARLDGARTRGGCGRGGGSVGGSVGRTERTNGVATVGGGSFEMIPAAAGGSTGTLRMAGSPLQMLRGGSTVAGGNHQPQFNVPKVDVVQWLLSSFGVDDYVVLKMDVEGAEMEIVPRLLESNATALIDVFLWECHAKWRGPAGKCQCAAWEEALRRSGVSSVYREPYRFAAAEKHRAAAWRPNATAARSRALIRGSDHQ